MGPLSVTPFPAPTSLPTTPSKITPHTESQGLLRAQKKARPCAGLVKGTILGIFTVHGLCRMFPEVMSLNAHQVNESISIMNAETELTSESCRKVDPTSLCPGALLVS